MSSQLGSSPARSRTFLPLVWALTGVGAVLTGLGSLRSTSFVAARPQPVPRHVGEQAVTATSGDADAAGWRMMPLGVPKVAYRIPGAPNAEWIDIYNRLYRERIIFLGKEIDDRLANEIIGVLLYLDSEESNKPIYLYINSVGGSVVAGLAIYDTMQHIKSPVITINVGLAASMASFLLAAGEKGKRIALPHSRTMIHQAMGGAQGQAEDIKVEAQQILQIHENVVRMYARMTGKPADVIRHDLQRDNFMSAEQAKEYGLIDQVIKLQDVADLPGRSVPAADAPKESAPATSGAAATVGSGGGSEEAQTKST